MNTSSHSKIVIVDGHVHIYDCFDLDTLLDAAYHNFTMAVPGHQEDKRFTGFLLLAETSRDNWFSSARRGGRGSQDWVRWRCDPLSQDHCTVLAQRISGENLFIVAGRQVVTAEGLEVLAIATDSGFHDGVPLIELVPLVQASGGIPVIPWGAGKWLGHRGRLLSKLLRSRHTPGLFLGDNGGRPSFWRNPSHFQAARDIGIRILPGTDPLPLPIEASRVGSFGFMFCSTVSASQPAQDLLLLLMDPNLEIRPYGKLERPYDFLRKQIRIRMGWRSNVSE